MLSAQVVTVVDNKHKHDYYYVLHYILDMDWCHLVPMHSKSVFGGDSFRSGRPRSERASERERERERESVCVCVRERERERGRGRG